MYRSFQPDFCVLELLTIYQFSEGYYNIYSTFNASVTYSYNSFTGLSGPRLHPGNAGQTFGVHTLLVIFTPAGIV